MRLKRCALVAARVLLLSSNGPLKPMTTSNVRPTAERPVVKALIAALPQGTVLLDADVTTRGAGIWRTDHLLAQVLIRPKTTEEVSQALRICFEHDQPVVPQGGLTGLVEGGLTQ